MRVDRNTDLRLVHGRPDGWWARANWDYQHKTKAEQADDGARNLVVILAVIFGFIFLAWASFWVATIGAVGLIFAFGLPLQMWNRAASKKGR